MSAIAIINREEKKINVSARLFFYGNHASTELGQAICDEISLMYNDADAIVSLEDGEYSVFFDIKFAVVEGTDIVDLAKFNRDHRNNFIRIEEKNHAERSFMGFGLGDNVGHWLISDNLGKSTTAAHEFGHGLGLDHPKDVDLRGRGIPPIMAPRGTLVDAQYQWAPTAIAGEFGGTLQPLHRRVKEEEVLQIFDNLTFTKENMYKIGHLSNILFDQIGNPLKIF